MTGSFQLPTLLLTASWSPEIHRSSCVRRKRLGEYSINGGSFIGEGGSCDATAEEVAEYLSQSPHWAKLMRFTMELGWDDVHRSLANK